MNMDEQKLTYEQFKEDILQWKNTHREEYNRFSRLMTNGDERQYLAICKAIFRQLPGIRREWELSWNDDSTDGLANIGMQFAENAVPGQIVDLYRKQREENNPLPDNISPVTLWGRIKSFFSGKSSKPGVTLSAPLVLSWLYYGKSFEAMVSMIEKQMKNPKADNADRLGCSLVVKQIINVSIRNGFRTRADWDRYFAMNSAIEKGNVGEWALQTITADMKTDEESRDTVTTRTEDSVRGSVVQRVAGKKKIQERPLADYLDHENKEVVLQTYPRLYFRQYKCHSSGITVLCIKGVRSGCGYAYSQGVQHGADIAVPRFAVIEKRERHTAVGRVPENGKTRYQGRQRPDGTLDRE